MTRRVAFLAPLLFITFTLLMLQLQSFRPALLVFLTGPLGIAGRAGPRARGRAWDAIVESAGQGFRPIVLTATAAVLAMIPLSRRGFWGPMAVAIMGSLIVVMALTLLALPAMYAAWFRVYREPIGQVPAAG